MPRCSSCHAAWKKTGIHAAENMSFLHDADRNEFYVYILDTDAGHYVGHSQNVGIRFQMHVSDKVPSTRGLQPKLVWVSDRFETRAEAAGFEAALKTLRDQRHPRFKHFTGREPMVFKRR